MLKVVRPTWETWKRIGRKIGDAQSRLLLTGFYFVILGPFAVGLRWKSDPLAIKAGRSSGWRMRSEQCTPAKRARLQF